MSLLTVKQFRAFRDIKIYRAFVNGNKQKEIAAESGLSESRVKAICAEQREIVMRSGETA
jgi:FixJ family two-component response regulator